MQYAKETAPAIEAKQEVISALKTNDKAKLVEKEIEKKWTLAKKQLNHLSKMKSITPDIKNELSQIDKKYSDRLQSISISGEKNPQKMREKLENVRSFIDQFTVHINENYIRAQGIEKLQIANKGNVNENKFAQESRDTTSIGNILNPKAAFDKYVEGGINIAKAGGKELASGMKWALDNGIVVPAKFYTEIIAAGAKPVTEFIVSCGHYGVRVPGEFWIAVAKKGGDVAVASGEVLAKGGILIFTKGVYAVNEVGLRTLGIAGYAADAVGFIAKKFTIAHNALRNRGAKVVGQPEKIDQ